MKTALALALAVLVSASCSSRERRSAWTQEIGGEASLARMLEEALHRADPQGAVLVIGWSTSAPPSVELQAVIDRWSSHGLIPVGVCIDLQKRPGDPKVLERLRSWERDHRLDFESLVFEGDASHLSERFRVEPGREFLVLLSEQGMMLWMSDGAPDLDRLEEMLASHLGEPTVA